MTVSLDQAQDWVADPAMNAEQAAAVIDLLLEGTLEPEVGGALLRQWHARGETGAELAGVVKALRTRALRVPIDDPVCDVCGTGGSGRDRFNVSTTVAVVLAAAGIPVAKHGNKGSRVPNGSFDLLEILGMPLGLSPEALAELHHTTGLCFLFARAHHPAVGAAVPYRKAAGGRTVFNLAGPLANPVPVGAQVIGCCDESTARVIADALDRLDAAAALVVWGHPGIDEVSITGPTGWLHVAHGAVSQGSFAEGLHPELEPEAVPAGEAERNAELFSALIEGREQGPLREMVAVNAGVAIDLWNHHEPTLQGPGYRRARELLAAGVVGDQWRRTLAEARRLAGS